MCAAILLAAFLLFSAQAESSQGDAFLNRFQGAWQGGGTAFGMPARLHMKWEWVLGRKFLRLTLKNEMRGAQTRIFEGHAYYQPAGEGKYEAMWFDSQGASYSVKGNVEGDSLIALWGANQKQGKSIYRFLEQGKIEVVDSVRQKDGTWKEFGRFVVVRE